MRSVCDMAQTQHDPEGAKCPRASAVFEAILYTKRTITIIYFVTMAP